MIYCIGTSHVTFFSGHTKESLGFPNVHGDRLPEFRTAHISAYLAYNLRRPNHPVNEGINKVLSQIPDRSTIMFMFGEVDCRAHIPKYCGKFGSMNRAARHAVEVYMEGVRPYKDRNYRIVMWGPHIACRAIPIWRASGTWEEIADATEYFNRHLQEMCDAEGIPFRTLFDWIMENEIYNTKPYYVDSTHLSPKCLPKAYEVMGDLLEKS